MKKLKTYPRDIINNQAQQAYIKLCNKYGVDYRPENIEKSGQELLEKNPQAYYELKYELERLESTVVSNRAEVADFIQQRNTQIALAAHKDMLSASPALMTAVQNYMNTYRPENPQAAVNELIQMAAPMYKEAFEMGKLYAQQEALKQAANNPANVLNSNTMVNNNSYSGQAPKVFTREEIQKMDDATFAKYEKEIDRQIKEGLIT